MKGYDRVAKVYDRLSRLVYGNAIVTAQRYAVGFIPAGSRVLVVGGGTGWILEEISKVHAVGLSITYVEVSAKMMELARQKSCGDNEVTFILSKIEDVPLGEMYDVVVTPFLFDNFSEAAAGLVLKQIERRLVAGALWLYTDFQVTEKNSWWQKRILQSMYLFFRLAGVVKITSLTAMEKHFAENGFTLMASNTFYKTFIITAVYSKDK